MKQPILLLLVLVMTSLLLPSPVQAQTATVLCSSTDWRVDKLNGEIRIFHKSGTKFPQYGALHLSDSYFRLNYGPGSGWGTSVILMPVFWSGGKHYQGAGVSVSCRIVDTLLELTLKGTIKTLAVTGKIKLAHPASTFITASVSVAVSGTVPLDTRPGEAFKLVTLSSMHISGTQWDSRQVCVSTQCFSIPRSGWIVPSTQVLTSTSFKLIGGTSTWKTNAPTIVISSLNASRRITGWVTDLKDPNEDNVSFWAATNQVLSSWSYKITAQRP